MKKLKIADGIHMLTMNVEDLVNELNSLEGITARYIDLN
jgi:hypothetical protein